MLDVGQGDALFIESPTGTQVLIDGGPRGEILKELSRVMSPFDKTIDALIITNPDADHIAGFLDVLENYRVEKVFESGTRSGSSTFSDLKTRLEEHGVEHIRAQKGMNLNMGGGVFLEVLFPDRDVTYWTTNDGSIVSRLSYGGIVIMLMGDATAKTEEIVLRDNNSEKLRSSFLKVGHHGSRTSSSYKFIKAVFPEYSLVSSGKENRYGHPHKEVLDTLSSFGSKILRTDLLGTIVIKSDGENQELYYMK